MSKVGLVLEGGSYRGIFSAGVLDYLIEMDVDFPYVVGVSSGAGNAANFVAKQPGRTKKVITHEDTENCFGISQVAKGGKMLNLPKMLDYEKEPFDEKTFFASHTVSEYVVTDARLGTVEYLRPKKTYERLLALCQASCSIPLMSSPAKVDGKEYFDGSIIDSVPFKRAFDQGCDKVVVVLTRCPGDEPTDYTKMKLLFEMCLSPSYPKVTDAMMVRKAAYEKQMKELEAFVKLGKAFVVRPEVEPIAHFEKSIEKLNDFYDHGHSVAVAKYAELLEFMK